MGDGTGEILQELMDNPNFSTSVACVILIAFIFLCALVICNMLIGVMCEVVAEVAAKERDSKAVSMLKQSILTFLQKYDDGDGMISQEELESVMNEPEPKAVLASLNVDRVFLLALQKMLHLR